MVMPANRQLLTIECLLCGNSTANRLLFQLSRPVVKCRACNLVFAVPKDSIAQSRDYNESYYRQGIYADYLEERISIGKNAGRILRELETLVRGRTLLDVGCAAGFFLEAARARGWTVRGLDVSSYASEYARRELNLDVESGSIESTTESSSKFDVVTLWDTIEHLSRPDLALINIRRRLKSEGMLALTTGDYGSLLRRLTGKRWRLFTDPTHNFFFDEATLKRLLNQTGFEVVRIMRTGKWVSLSMVLHQSPLPFKKRAQASFSAIHLNPSLYVNLYDVMTVFAKVIR